MTKTEIIQHLHKRLKKVNQFCNELLEDFELEAIHNFRVEIKKLRAFMRLLNTMKAMEEPLKLNGKLKKCYRIAGEIRNRQLHNQRIIQLCRDLEIEPPVSYLNLFSVEEKMMKQQCRSIAKNLSFNDLEEHTVSHVRHKLSEKAKYVYVKRKEKVLKGFLLSPHLSDEDLHGLRKVIKDLLYSWTYVIAYVELLPQFFAHKEKLEELGERIGDFGDLCTAMNFLTHDYITDIKKKEISVCYLLRLYFEKNKDNLNHMIVSLIGSANYKDKKSEVTTETYSF